MPDKIQSVIVGLGEVLWDLFPAGKQLGGAPTNFAYISSLLGNAGIVASRIGSDELAQELRGKLAGLNLPTAFVQADSEHPTGTVRVTVDGMGQPHFEIEQRVAWDFLEWSAAWRDLARKADAICFGSLAQRSPQSRETIQAFLRAARPSALRIFDVNLRQSYFDVDGIAESMKLARIVKLNDEELPRVMRLLSLEHGNEKSSATMLLQKFDLELVCVTRGAKGSLLVGEDASDEHPGIAVNVVDTVGAGDAFTAGLVYAYLHGVSLPVMNEAANCMGAWVSTQAGGTPPLDAVQLEQIHALLLEDSK